MKSNLTLLLDKIRRRVDTLSTEDEKLLAICELLKAEVPHYHWVGFYLVNPGRERELILGPYVGDPTEHTHIDFGQGICGQAADTEQPFIIQDVTQETNYLSCSPNVRSEIVIPVFQNGIVVGELDIDSHDLSPFVEDDRVFLEQVCEIAAQLI
ncbi:MAG: GAF domain-containing protein [Anaerolineae bacterium]|nr:GAF domain-containing protein [Anaerolineae bacterium]